MAEELTPWQKLADFIRKGSRGSKQSKHALYTTVYSAGRKEHMACALAAAFKGATGRFPDSDFDRTYCTEILAQKLGISEYEDAPNNPLRTWYREITHMNDEQRLTRPQIAKIVERWKSEEE
jgi:hypothetical protein